MIIIDLVMSLAVPLLFQALLVGLGITFGEVSTLFDCSPNPEKLMLPATENGKPLLQRAHTEWERVKNPSEPTLPGAKPKP